MDWFMMGRIYQLFKLWKGGELSDDEFLRRLRAFELKEEEEE